MENRQSGPATKSKKHARRENYRPIRILNSVSKLFEVLNRKRRLTKMDNKEDRCDHQYGFPKGKSTIKQSN